MLYSLAISTISQVGFRKNRCSLAGMASMVSVLLLSACTPMHFKHDLEKLQTETVRLSEAKLVWIEDASQKASYTQEVNQRLTHTLTQNEAVQIALMQSPAIQAQLAMMWRSHAQLAQYGQIRNPVFHFERARFSNELELTRALSVGLFELLTLPQRQHIAQAQLEELGLQSAQAFNRHITTIRMAWVEAVAAQERFLLAGKILKSAEAGQTLALRMEQAGNFTVLNRAKEQNYFFDAKLAYQQAAHEALQKKETLSLLLGLNTEQISLLKLPDTLPPLPKEALPAHELGLHINEQRLDIRLAKSELNQIRVSQGLQRLDRVFDIGFSIAAIQKSSLPQAQNTHSLEKGHRYEVSVQLPIFNWGSYQSQEQQALLRDKTFKLEQTLLQAASSVKTHYAQYLNDYEAAKLYRDEIVPLKKTISNENLLRYNAMLISVFDLLEDARSQARTAQASIQAQAQFHLTHALLQATMLGVNYSDARISSASRYSVNDAASSTTSANASPNSH